MRTQEQILEKIKDYEDKDFLGVKREDLINFLDYENAKEYLRPEVTEDEWKTKENTKEAIKDFIFDYMEFAWDKANDCRGISAGRSIEHFEARIWLYDEEGLWKKIEAIEYEHYGKEKLIAICEHFGWDYKQWDDGVRTNSDD